jgi:hypothetical protein
LKAFFPPVPGLGSCAFEEGEGFLGQRSLWRLSNIAMDSTTSSSSGGGDIETWMKQLGISEEDLHDVIFEEETTRWLAISRVFTEGEYSSF